MSVTSRWLLQCFLYLQGIINKIPYLPELIEDSRFTIGISKFIVKFSSVKKYFSQKRLKEYWERIFYALLLMAFFLPLNWAWFALFLPGLFFTSFFSSGGLFPLLWLAWSFLSALFSPEFPFVFLEFIQEAILILAGFSAGYFCRKKSGWFLVFLLAAALIIGLNLIQAYALPTYPKSWVSDSERGAIPIRITGFFQNPNLNGIYLAYMLPLLLTGWETQGLGWGEKTKYFSGILSFLSWLVIILTFSRTAWVAAFITLVCYWFTDKKANIIRLILIVAMLFIIFPPIKERIFSLLFRENTFKYRLQIWNATWSLVKQYPCTGVGKASLTHWLAHLPNYSAVHVHNHYLQIMAEKGIPALLIMLWIVYRVISVLFRERNHTCCFQMNHGICMALLSQLVAGFTESIWVSPLPLFLFWFGVALMDENRKDRD
jgi:O-antigen ligase